MDGAGGDGAGDEGGIVCDRAGRETPDGQAISWEKEIPVRWRRYPRVTLKVPERYTAPSAEEQREIEQDKKIKDEAFKTVSAGREWRGNFTPPVAAKISEVFGVQRIFNEQYG